MSTNKQEPGVRIPFVGVLATRRGVRAFAEGGPYPEGAVDRLLADMNQRISVTRLPFGLVLMRKRDLTITATVRFR